VNPLPVVNIVAIPNDTVCLNETITLDATTSGAIEYLWMPDGQTSPVIQVDSSGVGAGSKLFVVYVTDVNICQAIDSITITFYNCVGFSEDINSSLFSVYPNPAFDQLVIQNLIHLNQEYNIEPQQNIDFEIYNFLGQKMMKDSFAYDENQSTVDVSVLKNGTYLILIKQNNRVLAVKKFLILRQ
jgi:hypothetical protein